MTDYTELDEAIIAHIAREPSFSHPRNSIALRSLAKPLSNWALPQHIIDDRMQSLRKAGRIKFDRRSPAGKRSWSVVEPKP